MYLVVDCDGICNVLYVKGEEVDGLRGGYFFFFLVCHDEKK